MPDQKKLPPSLAAIQNALSGRVLETRTQPVKQVFVKPSELIQFVTDLEAWAQDTLNLTLTAKPDFIEKAGLSPDGVTPQCLYAAYAGIPGNNVAVYYKGKGSLAGELANFPWAGAHVVLPTEEQAEEMADADRQHAPAKTSAKKVARKTRA